MTPPGWELRSPGPGGSGRWGTEASRSLVAAASHCGCHWRLAQATNSHGNTWTLMADGV